MPKQEKIDRTIADCADLVLQLSKALVKIKGANRHDLWQLHPERTAPDEYMEARVITDRLISKVKTLNPNMLSKRFILGQLLYQTAAVIFDYSITDKEMISNARNAMDKLIHLEAWRTIDLPLVNLAVKNPSINFGLITIYPLLDIDQKDTWWERIQLYANSYASRDVVAYAQVRAPGDNEYAYYYSSDVVDEMLLILRAVGLDVTSKPQLQFGVLNDHSVWKSRPLRIGKPEVNFSMEFASQYAELMGPGIAPYNVVTDLLDKIPQSTQDLLNKLIISDFHRPSTEMKRKFLTGLRWLGQATLPDSIDAKFVKLCFALESLIGGEAKDANLSTRGLTASLAERAAFIAGSNSDERLAIHTQVINQYGLRSGIVHGGKAQILESNLADFAKVVRKVTWSMLVKLDALKTVDEFQTWVFEMRYKLPELSQY